MPIAVPAGTEVAINASSITVKGPLGTLTQP
jgi:large subunit ribosomal protein L6